MPTKQTIKVSEDPANNHIYYRYKRQTYTINLYGRNPQGNSNGLENKGKSFITSTNKTAYNYVENGAYYTTTFKYGKVIDIPNGKDCYSYKGYDLIGWQNASGNSVKPGVVNPLSDASKTGYKQLFGDSTEVSLYTVYKIHNYSISYN